MTAVGHLHIATIGTDLLAPFTFAGAFLFVARLSAAIVLPLVTLRFPRLSAAEVPWPGSRSRSS